VNFKSRYSLFKKYPQKKIQQSKPTNTGTNHWSRIHKDTKMWATQMEKNLWEQAEVIHFLRVTDRTNAGKQVSKNTDNLVEKTRNWEVYIMGSK